MRKNIFTLLGLALLAALLPNQVRADEITMTVGRQTGETIQLIFKVSEAKAMTIEGAFLEAEDVQGDYTIRNYSLKTQDVKLTGTFTYFCCNDNNLSSLDVSKCPNLETLHCHNNDLTSLDMTKCPLLKVLRCSGNGLLGHLDVSNCEQLVMLGCSFSGLEELNVSNCKELTVLHCYGNAISTLKLDNCVKLERFNCSVNFLTDLDVSACNNLTLLNCNDNDLTTLDVTNCNLLQDLRCGGNKMTELKLGNAMELFKLECFTNYIKGDKMDALIASLPLHEDEEKGLLYVHHNDEDFVENNVCTTNQVAAAKARGWKPLIWINAEWIPYEGSDPAGITDAVMQEDLDMNEVYDLSGRKLPATAHGISIIKTKNGKAAKIAR